MLKTRKLSLIASIVGAREATMLFSKSLEFLKLPRDLGVGGSQRRVARAPG